MNRVTITVPSIQQNGNPVEDLASVQNVVRNQLCEWFGGVTAVTATAGTGSWIDSEGNTVSENVTVFSSYTDKTNAMAIITGIGSHVKNVCNQESVLVTVEKGVEVKFI